eukprot:TRINITY_DN49999_c0_g1_i1.p2 TRINITY_DN49999_c0_g1~~TRINITY_DN49999_c0_g1_i1.p2  ORF type:complete len:109 (+),score=7.39 TRINITY_DN49999_c0_g1_i1:546-872(+)
MVFRRERDDPSVSYALETDATTEPLRGIDGFGRGASMVSTSETQPSNNGMTAQETIGSQSRPQRAVKDNARRDSGPGLAQRRGIGSIARCVPLKHTTFGTSPDVSFLG